MFSTVFMKEGRKNNYLPKMPFFLYELYSMSCMKGGNRITKRSDPSADDAPKTKKIPLTDVGRFLKCAKVVQNNALGAVTSIPLNLRWYSDGNPNKFPVIDGSVASVGSAA